MILIDRELSEQVIILTLDGLPAEHILYLVHDATQTSFSIDLGINQTVSPDRYDLFLVPTVDFSAMPEGYYTYKIKEVYTAFKIETGKLYIKPTIAANFISAPDSDNDIIIYN